MTPSLLASLPLSEKITIVLTEGRLLDSRAIENEFYVELYKLENCFVEFFYAAQTMIPKDICLISVDAILEEYVNIFNCGISIG